MLRRIFGLSLSSIIFFKNRLIGPLFSSKGGTCLSKCYDAIHRFSEDVDISTNWDLLEYSKEGPLKERTRSQRKKFTLLPPPERIPELKADLLAMKDMFYGPVVPIEKVFEQLQLSEKDFASLPLS
jgi:hypothetical protein